ncbi:hypothetical protein MUK71_03785 [Arthrobacter zhangbolii]|uniref:Uncharacterized protein n=1 Tax=Arthrobacter zhangbolii TaxID=2886936 RepID=A0A9X1S9L8_9MICC|nr:hypothetical protein [Arthrobacter zhangbolii]MCC3273238.1 hypothetical protein [Arthrobacter zhangbolii]UON92775.1 hypothetical protein MUK71_03785 [Arthrobacter zhangbolii]
MDWIWIVVMPVTGVVLGFAAGWLTKRGLARREEARALNELVTYLHLKRMLAPMAPRSAQIAALEPRFRSSVHDIRENLMETLARLQPGSTAGEVLMRMSAACNRYLRITASEPQQYQFELMELRRNLDEDLRILTDGRRDIRYLSPGEAPGRRDRPHSATPGTTTGTTPTPDTSTEPDPGPGPDPAPGSSHSPAAGPVLGSVPGYSAGT